MTSHGHFLDAFGLTEGPKRFWLIRHAIVDKAARRKLYGTVDVALCPDRLEGQKAYYARLARRLPENAVWYSSPLTRTRDTAQAIFDNGYGTQDVTIEGRFIEQSLGNWQNLLLEDVPRQLQQKPHPFWSLSATECPPEGESMLDVCARVGHALDDLSEKHVGKNIVVVSHGGAIRAAIAHALKLHPETALHFCI
ncbi:MAG: histidine phosphatase family protein [Acetobacteraceae bacterium]